MYLILITLLPVEVIIHSSIKAEIKWIFQLSSQMHEAKLSRGQKKKKK